MVAWKHGAEPDLSKLAATNLLNLPTGSKAVRTVLVVEENDISSTNAERVFHALMRAEKGKPDAPDEIYLVSTFLPEIWRVTCLRRIGRDYCDDGERFHPFDPAKLKQLTKR